MWWGVWVHISKTYQFLSASFRNLQMQLILLITKHSLCVTCGSQWSVKLEEVAHSFLRVIPCSQTCFWTEFWLDIFFLEGKCQNLILFNQNHFKRGVWYCFEIQFPARRKAIRATVAELHKFSPLTAIFAWKNHKITQRKIQTWVPFRQKCQDKTFFNLKINYFIK